MKEKSMKKSIQALYLALLSVLGVAAVALRTAGLLSGFDFASGYFSSKLINNVSVVIVVTAVVLFFTFLIYKKDYKPSVAIGTPRDYATSACVGVALIIMAVEIAIYSANAGAAQATSSIASAVTSLAALLAAVATLYFLFSVISGKGAPRASAVFSMALMLFFVFYALTLYFDAKTPINSPVKLCDQMAYIAFAVFFIYETRISLGRPIFRMYAVSGLTATLLSAYSAIPSLIVYFVRGEIISSTVSESILTLSLFAFVLVRTVSALSAEEDKENEIVGLVKALHDARTNEIEDTRATRAQYNNNEENREEENDNYEIELPTENTEDGTERTN